MGLRKIRINLFWVIILGLASIAIFQQWRYDVSPAGEARKKMKTYYIGRFSIAIPVLMEQKLRSSNLRCTEIKEIAWPAGALSEKMRDSEWERFMAEVKELTPPKGKEKVIIKHPRSYELGKWTKGLFYYSDDSYKDAAQWKFFMDAGPTGVWVVGDPSVVDKEIDAPRMLPNIQNILKAYECLDLDHLQGPQPNDRFYLQHGAINLPYCGQEESIVRFEEEHPLNLALVLEMYMDVTQERETISLIEGTRAMLAAALLVPNGGLSKIRLRKREVAGMPGEESVLKAWEGNSKALIFTWQYNGKDDSGEYPTTRIEMQSEDQFNLHEKLQIWDAILDSMKPMFQRKN